MGAWAVEAIGVDGHGSRWIPGDDVTSTLTTSGPGECLGQSALLEAFGLGMALAGISWRMGGSNGPS